MCRIAFRAMKHLSHHQEIRKQWYLRKKLILPLSVWVEWPQLTLCFSIKLLWCVYMLKWHNQLMWVPCDWDDHTAIRVALNITVQYCCAYWLLYPHVMMCIHVKVTQSAYVGILWLRWPHSNKSSFKHHSSVLLCIVVTLSTCYDVYAC